ncbi:ornithine cyclodeaminase family protein [Ilumatobacter nonamiensis]|uniref:ornithine cyclodeaminase family protein n=1 Tax=Ilumatobacter nonamiensis TaxID=467093 RepID=UPI0003481B9A|nr:ornithine cyclodeaminase [Ilumatobacter nonamiensis]
MTAATHLEAASVEALLTWPGVMEAIENGHRSPPAEIDDTLLRRGDDSLLSRAAWIDGLGCAVKTATIFPSNSTVDLPTVHGSVSLFSDRTGRLDCTLDFHMVTKWKTAADSALAASRLARPDTNRILIVGSGTVAASMVDAYRSVFPGADVGIWSRTPENARALAAAASARVVSDLRAEIAEADLVCTATMSSEPVVSGDWLRPGQHIDLIGGYRPDMREADDECIHRASVFVDSVDTALDVGDIGGPVGNGILDPERLVDFGGLESGAFARSSDDEITLFKNAGGAHLDLMVARHMFERHSASDRRRLDVGSS